MIEKQISGATSSAATTLCWIDECMDRAARNKPFLVVDGKEFSYGDFAERVRRLTGVIRDIGCPDNGSAIITRSAKEMSCLFVSALRAGVPVISINPDLTSAERTNALKASGISHVFIDEAIDKETELPPGVSKTIISSTAPGNGGLVGRLLGGTRKVQPESEYERLIKDAAPIAQVDAFDPDRTAFLLMTSGTTSHSKIVELSHGNLTAQLEVFLQVYQFTPETRLLNPLPLHFVDGLFHGLLQVLFTGATLYRPASLSFDDLQDLVLSVYRDRITHMFVVPTILAMMNALPDSFDDAFDTPDFKMIRASGDRLSVPLWEAFEDRFSVKLSNEYGLSETTGAATYCVPGIGTHKRGTIGKPVGCEVRVVAKDGSDVEPGEVGELLVKGGIIAKGYRNNPEATSAAFENGWLRTGDLAKFDDEGFLVITGRASGLIISGGINISPAEVSDVLLTHPDIADAAVFGVEDHTLGQKVVAAIKINSTAVDPSMKQQEIVDYCSRRLARHKTPRSILFVNEIPRTLSGKPMIRELRNKFDDVTANAIDAEKVTEKDVLELAANVFNCRASDLSPRSTAKSTAGWDSFAHVQLILEAERRFNVSIPSREFLNIQSLDDLARVIEGLDGSK